MPKPTKPAIVAEAVEMVRSGESVRGTARALGVSQASVSRWGQSQGVSVPTTTTAQAIAANREKYAAKRAELAEGFAALADKALTKANDAIDNDEGSNAKAFAVTAAIATDKHLLLTGEATSRHETQRSPDEARLRVAELLEAWQARRDGASGG